MEIAIIVGMANNRVIGNGSEIPWHLPADFKHFKKTTMGCPIIMGRKTRESIGRALPGRKNLVISRNPAVSLEGTTTYTSLKSALDACKSEGYERVFVIGGAQIYQQAIPLATQLFLTEIDVEVDGDICFPELDMNKWKQVSSAEHKKDDKNQYDMKFLEYVRDGSPPPRG